MTFAATVDGQGLEVWQPGKLETIEDIQAALRELERIRHNEQRVTQALYERMGNPVGSSSVHMSPTGVFGFGFVTLQIEAGLIQIGDRADISAGFPNKSRPFGGSCVELESESGASDSLWTIRDDFNELVSTSPDTYSPVNIVPLLLLIAKDGHAIEVFEGSISLGATSRMLNNKFDTLFLAKVHNNWQEISYSDNL